MTDTKIIGEPQVPPSLSDFAKERLAYPDATWGERELARRILEGDLLTALEDIAAGNVPRGFLDGVESESKAHFQERFATWMQKRARAAIAKTEG